jgi:hypothetical protein
MIRNHRQRRKKLMQKKYVYAITLVILSLTMWIGYYSYLEYRPQEYKNGTFVEAPCESMEEILELSA